MPDQFNSPIAVGVFENRNAIMSFWTLGRWLGKFFVFGSQPVVDLHRFQAVGVGELSILQDPHSPAIIECDRQRLSNQRFGDHQIDRQIVRDLEFLGCLAWW